MKKILDKLKSIFKTTNNYKIFFIVILIIALIFGSLFALLISSSDKALVKDYLLNYFNNIKTNNLNFLDMFLNLNINYISISLFIWILGISVIGLPINVFIFFTKGFTLGFTISSIIINYHFKGLIMSLIYLIPQLLYIFILYILLYYAITLSLKIFNTLIKKKNIDFKLIRNKYLMILLISIILIVITSLISSIMHVYLYKILLSFLK